MTIKKSGGPGPAVEIGTVLLVTTSSKTDASVLVTNLDGSCPVEDRIPWSRVIQVVLKM